VKHGFYLFIDEAGDEGLDRVRPLDPNGASEYFVLCGILVRASKYAELAQSFNKAKAKLGKEAADPVHFRDLDDAQKLSIVADCAAIAIYRSLDESWFGTVNPRYLELLGNRFIRSNGTLQLPESIFSFNADTLFETMFRTFKKVAYNSARSEWLDPPQTFSRVVRSSQDIWGHIPIYHLHGCLPPKSSRRTRINENSVGMIFPENSYTGLAGRVFTWAQNTFLNKSQTELLPV
jgi:hypothetical protein